MQYDARGLSFDILLACSFSWSAVSSVSCAFNVSLIINLLTKTNLGPASLAPVAAASAYYFLGCVNRYESRSPHVRSWKCQAKSLTCQAAPRCAADLLIWGWLLCQPPPLLCLISNRSYLYLLRSTPTEVEVTTVKNNCIFKYRSLPSPLWNLETSHFLLLFRTLKKNETSYFQSLYGRHLLCSCTKFTLLIWQRQRPRANYFWRDMVRISIFHVIYEN